MKSADPHALVGGPAIARPNDDTPYRDAFLEYVRTEHLPLDFYSWHWYATDSDDPLDFIRISKDTRARLDKHGFTHTRSMVTEWNYGLMDPMPTSVQRASFITAAIIYMQDAPIDAATLYRADSLFGPDGETPDKTGQALIALGRLKDTPYRLRVQRSRPQWVRGRSRTFRGRAHRAGAVEQLPDPVRISRARGRPMTYCTYPRCLMSDCSPAAASPIETTPATISPLIISRRIAATASSGAAFPRHTTSPIWVRPCTQTHPSGCRTSCRHRGSS